VKKILRRLPLLLFLGLVVAGLVYGFRPQPVAVDLGTVTRGPMRVTVDEDGKTRVQKRYMITAPVAGKLRRIELKAGTDLGGLYARSLPLAILEPTFSPFLDPVERKKAEDRKNAAEARVEQTRELYKKAEQQEAFAKTEYRRIERSTSAGGTSRQELDEAELKLRVAERELVANRFAVQVAEFELKQARSALHPPTGPENGAHLPIYSPIDRGMVLKVVQESERVVAAGAEILEVGDTQLLEAEIDVLTQDAVKVLNKAEVELVHWGGAKPLKGWVRTRESGFMKVSALGVEEQRVNVIVDFELPEEYRGRVGDGYRVEARIVIWKGENVLKVPAGALFRQGKQWAVYVRQEGKAVLRTIKIDNDHNNGLEAEVLEGLKEGDEVVLHPGDKVKEGVAIAPRQAN
jgi:HlyD family secretion protein